MLLSEFMLGGTSSVFIPLKKNKMKEAIYFLLSKIFIY